jgi:bifunctional DNase/RNase
MIGESMFIEMRVAGITLDPMTKMPIVILKDSSGENALPIWIGIAEASAIATQLEKIDLARPMTHDLLRNNQTLPVDSRPSDAIALALRTESPIFVDEEVLNKSRHIDTRQAEEEMVSPEDRDKWSEILENLSPEAFGKYKM